MNPLLEQFLLEARENLAFIDQNIEKIGGDDPELLNSVFRAAHTLKGGSGIVGFEAVKNITHHAEDLLDMLRAGKLEFQETMIESLYNAFDEVMNLIEAAEETGDVVDADEARIEEIAQELSGLMGKSNEVKTWNCPFVLAEDKDRIRNLPMPFLSQYSHKIPFRESVIDEAFCAKVHLYAISLDIDESCMVYGNDPVYALSLLDEKVLGIHTCMSETKAKEALSGLEDPDGLLLKVQMTALIYATYDEITDALFNFSDELKYCPLDIETLLQINIGEQGHTLDILKELAGDVQGVLATHDRGALLEKINATRALIGKDTIQSSQLERLSHILGLIEDADMAKLMSFFVQLPSGQCFEFDPDAVTAFQTAPESSFDSSPNELSEAMKNQLKALLEQQLMALQEVGGEEVAERVEAMLNAHIRTFIPEMPESFGSEEVLSAWLESQISGEPMDSPIPSAVTAAPVSVAVETKAVAAPQPTIQAAPVKEVPAVKAEVVETIKPQVSAPISNEDAADKISAEAQASGSKKSVIGKTVKIEQESIDNLMNIVGELLVAKNSLPYLADGVHAMNSEGIRRAIMEKYTFINRLAEQLQDLIMSMRMLPISYVFDRYPKLVRDISKNLGKKVELSMDGGETKLDKNMIEMLADPMIHIMRNSLDHGIETPEVRAQKGKNPEGYISLNAYAQSDKIIIEIKDDGAGINIDRVVQKVLEKNLLTIEQIDAMSDDEKAALVMLPGLSTAETISEYSGRGVGMDVVKKSIENFGGTIRIKTIANVGTTITLSIPVSLAVTSLLHVSMSNVHYGFPMDSVSETVKIEVGDIEYLNNEPFVYIRGEVIPLLFIQSMLDQKVLEGKALPIVVLNIKGNLLAVVVNELLGQLDVVQKPLEGIMEHHPIFSGTALLGNGQIIMAIDPLGLLQISHAIKAERKAAS